MKSIDHLILACESCSHTHHKRNQTNQCLISNEAIQIYEYRIGSLIFKTFFDCMPDVVSMDRLDFYIARTGIVMTPSLSLPVASLVVITTTCGTSSGDNVGIMTTLSFGERKDRTYICVCILACTHRYPCVCMRACVLYSHMPCAFMRGYIHIVVCEYMLFKIISIGGGGGGV